MAERRMFSKTIIESDKFNSLSIVSRMLYINMNLAADDEGFLGNSKKIMKNSSAKLHHFVSLLDENFIILFESGAVAITHWHVHNKIPGIRRNPTQFIAERASVTLGKDGIYRFKDKVNSCENERAEVCAG